MEQSILPEHVKQRATDSTEGHIYRVIELVGTSEKSIEEAVNAAVERAHKTIRNLRWFEIARTSGHIEDGKLLSGDAEGWHHNGGAKLTSLLSAAGAHKTLKPPMEHSYFRRVVPVS
jgi:flavin-binding protein dodecin